jgi:hypothetical protein
MNVKIAYLKNYQEYVTAVASWSYDIGCQYDAQMTRKGQIQIFKQRCNIDKLPLTLVALDDNNFIIGTCSLCENEDIRPDLTLGLPYTLFQSITIKMLTKNSLMPSDEL